MPVTIYLEGKEVNFKSSKEALENGVAMVHQELNQALKRNVMDNMWLGRYPKVAGPMISEKKMYACAPWRSLTTWTSSVDPKTIMSTMPVSQRQMVEIAKAVSYNSKVIVFDEPTSSLTETEVEHLFQHHQYAAGPRLRHHLYLPQDGRRSCASPMTSPSCGTASGWLPSPPTELDHGATSSS